MFRALIHAPGNVSEGPVTQLDVGPEVEPEELAHRLRLLDSKRFDSAGYEHLLEHAATDVLATPVQELPPPPLEDFDDEGATLARNFGSPSPLLPLRHYELAWTAEQQSIWDELGGGSPRSRQLQFRGRRMDRDVPGVQVLRGGVAIAAVAFDSSAFALLIPPGGPDSTTLRVAWEDERLYPIRQALAHDVPQVGSTARSAIAWRAYAGWSSGFRDGLIELRDEVAEWDITGLAHPLLLVGRICHLVGRFTGRAKHDPAFSHRLTIAERRDPLAPPRIETVGANVANHPIVVVHGTNGCGVDLAHSVAAQVALPRVVRFEHDTWPDIHTNAVALTDLISTLDSQEVSFVAHSRGGLVVQQAMHLLRHRNHPIQVARALTLGTPFRGTELVTAGSGARKIVDTGISAFGHFHPWAAGATSAVVAHLLGPGLPSGIASMSPTSPHIAWASTMQSDKIEAVGGDANLDNPPWYRTTGTAAIGQFSHGSLKQPHDFVVERESAFAGAAAITYSVDSDHMTYWLNDDVKRLFSTL